MTTRINRRTHAIPAFLLLVLASRCAWSFDALNDAQSLVYATPHLANTTADQMITYRYASAVAGNNAVSDTVALRVLKTYDDNRRDVSVDFLTGEHAMPLPNFDGYQGNPVIIAMLEHNAQAIGQRTGGGALYFRNRIRDALADKSTQVKTASLDHQGSTLATKSIKFKPYTDDGRLEDHPDIVHLEYTLVFSEAVPGGLVSIHIESVLDTTEGSNKAPMSQSLVLDADAAMSKAQ